MVLFDNIATFRVPLDIPRHSRSVIYFCLKQLYLTTTSEIKSLVLLANVIFLIIIVGGGPGLEFPQALKNL